MKISVEIPVSLSPSSSDMPSLRGDLNMAIVGKYNCNVRNNDGSIIPDPSIDSETFEDLTQAHHLFTKGFSAVVIAEFDTVNHTWEIVDFK